MDSTRVIIIRVINVIGSIVGFFIAARILLRLLNANINTPVVSWIYSLSGNLVYPFNGIFRDIAVKGAGTLDLSALVALFAYAILFTIVVSLINSITLPLIHEDDAGHVHSHI